MRISAETGFQPTVSRAYGQEFFRRGLADWLARNSCASSSWVAAKVTPNSSKWPCICSRWWAISPRCQPPGAPALHKSASDHDSSGWHASESQLDSHRVQALLYSVTNGWLLSGESKPWGTLHHDLEMGPRHPTVRKGDEGICGDKRVTPSVLCWCCGWTMATPSAQCPKSVLRCRTHGLRWRYPGKYSFERWRYHDRWEQPFRK